jgi:hypothetical protein
MNTEESAAMRLKEHVAGCGDCGTHEGVDVRCLAGAELLMDALEAEQLIFLEPIAPKAKPTPAVRVISEVEMLEESDEYGGGE